MPKKQLVEARQVVDTDTGEIIILETVARRPGEIVGVFEPKPRGESPPPPLSLCQGKQRYVKVRTARDQKRIYKKLTSEQKAFLFSLLPYMDWETNLLVGDGEDGESGKPLRWCHVEKIAGISKPHRIKLVRELDEKGIIGYMVVKGTKRGIVVNPQYALNGRIPQEALLAVFYTEKDIETE